MFLIIYHTDKESLLRVGFNESDHQPVPKQTVQIGAAATFSAISGSSLSIGAYVLFCYPITFNCTCYLDFKYKYKFRRFLSGKDEFEIEKNNPATTSFNYICQ